TLRTKRRVRCGAHGQVSIVCTHCAPNIPCERSETALLPKECSETPRVRREIVHVATPDRRERARQVALRLAQACDGEVRVGGWCEVGWSKKAARPVLHERIETVE